MKKIQTTTIQITSETKKALDTLKKYRRETYNDVLMRFLDEIGSAGKEPKETRKGKKTYADADAEQIKRKGVDPMAEQEY